MVLRKRLHSPFAMLMLVMTLVLSACGSAPAVVTPAAPTEAAAPAEAAPTEAAAPAEAAPTEAAPTEAAAAPTEAAAAPAADATTAAGAGGDDSTGSQPLYTESVDAKPRDAAIKPQPYPRDMFPLTQEKQTLRIALPSNTSVEDFNTNEFTKWYEEKTNVHIEWIILPSGAEALQKLNLMLSSGDIPDVIMGFYDITPALQVLYGSQGIFLPLNDLIAQGGPNIEKAFDAYPLVKEAVTAPDGNIYGLPEINDCYHCLVSQKLWIYKPWLDKLGLAVPTTIEEYQAVLKAFKEKDPNGNGEADELPLTGNLTAWNGPLDTYLMNPFTLNPGSRMVLNNGKIEANYAKPEWKQGLAYMSQLRADGLLDPNYFTMDNDQLLQLGQSDPPIIGSFVGGVSLSLAPASNEEGARWSQYEVVPPLMGPSGKRIQPSSPYGVMSAGRYIITKAAKDPLLALKWADGFYQQEIELNAYWGLKDVGWRWAEQGEKGIFGEPALYASIKTWGNTQNDHWSQSNPSYRSSDWRLGQFTDNPWDLETILYRESKKLEPYLQDPATAVPPLYLTTDQAQESAELEASLKEYVDEMMAGFILGNNDLDAEWDTYLQTLNDIGLPRYVEIQQAAYDAKYKK